MSIEDVPQLIVGKRLLILLDHVAHSCAMSNTVLSMCY